MILLRFSGKYKKGNDDMEELNGMTKEQMEDELRFMRKKAVTSGILTHGFIVAGILSLFITANVLIMLGFWIIAPAFGIPAGRAIKKRNETKNRLVNCVVGCVLRDVLGEDVEYDPFGELKPDKEAAPFCFPVPAWPAREGWYQEVAGGHHIKASYNGVNIELGNIGIGQTNKDKWDKCTTYSLFCGTWLICDFGRKPECVVSVSSLEKNADFFSKSERRVIIDDEQFSKRFCVNANDPQEAFKILTPQMMETILTVADKSCAGLPISSTL